MLPDEGSIFCSGMISRGTKKTIFEIETTDLSNYKDISLIGNLIRSGLEKIFIT